MMELHGGGRMEEKVQPLWKTCIGGVHQAQLRRRHCLNERQKVNMRHVVNEMRSIKVHSTDVK